MASSRDLAHDAQGRVADHDLDGTGHIPFGVGAADCGDPAAITTCANAGACSPDRDRSGSSRAAGRATAGPPGAAVSSALSPVWREPSAATQRAAAGSDHADLAHLDTLAPASQALPADPDLVVLDQRRRRSVPVISSIRRTLLVSPSPSAGLVSSLCSAYGQQSLMGRHYAWPVTAGTWGPDTRLVRWPRQQPSTASWRNQAVFEAKFMLPWYFSEEAAAEKHMPQLQHNMWVANSKAAALSVITGGGKWVEIKISADPLYQHLLMTAEKKFWRCVESGETPRLFGILRWSRLSEQFLRVDKWSLCRG